MTDEPTYYLNSRAACAAASDLLAGGLLALVALLVLPFLALLPAEHTRWLSPTCTLTLMRQNPLLRGGGRGAGSGLGLRRACCRWATGMFFALGGYAMGMYLMRQAVGRRSARVYVVPVVDRTAVVLGRHPVFCLGAA